MPSSPPDRLLRSIAEQTEAAGETVEYLHGFGISPATLTDLSPSALADIASAFDRRPPPLGLRAEDVALLRAVLLQASDRVTPERWQAVAEIFEKIRYAVEGSPIRRAPASADTEEVPAATQRMP